MKKSEVLTILTTTEMAVAMKKKHLSQITRLQENVPQKYHKAILSACDKKMTRERVSLKFKEETLNRLKGG